MQGTITLRRLQGRQAAQGFFIALGVFCVLLAALASLCALPASQADAQTITRRVVSKRCGRCGHLVSVRSQAGGRCPYCGAYWSYETSHTVRHGRSAHHSAGKASRHSRKSRAHQRAHRIAYFRPMMLPALQPIPRMEYIAPQPIEVVRPQYIPAPVAVPRYESAADAISRIRSQPYSPLPAPSAQAASGIEQGGLHIENQTAYTLTIHYAGVTNRTVTLLVGQSLEVSLPDGEYEVAAEVSDRSVRPFYGRHTYNSTTRYQQTFYIVNR